MTLGYWSVTCLVLGPLVILGAWFDHAQRRVPNWLNAVAAGAGLVAQGLYFGWSGVGQGALGCLVGLGVLIVPWAIHAVGAGDVKLLGAVGAWFGPWMTLVSGAVGGILGGVLAVLMIVASRRVASAWSNFGVITMKMCSRKTLFSEFGSSASFGSSAQMLPYGVPLAIGSLAVLAGRVLEWWMV